MGREGARLGLLPINGAKGCDIKLFRVHCNVIRGRNPHIGGLDLNCLGTMVACRGGA